MGLKESTAEKHQLAESTQFMKAVFAKTLPMDTWIDFTYQKWLWYVAIENQAAAMGLLTDLPDIPRASLIHDDYCNMISSTGVKNTFKQSTIDYRDYLMTIDDPDGIMAHLYTWHMGDMYGGQMIAKLIDAPHSHLIFQDRVGLIAKFRSKLNDSMADEANVAFDWAIKVLSEYDVSLG
jgi:heme oxygenase